MYVIETYAVGYTACVAASVWCGLCVVPMVVQLVWGCVLLVHLACIQPVCVFCVYAVCSRTLCVYHVLHLSTTGVGVLLSYAAWIYADYNYFLYACSLFLHHVCSSSADPCVWSSLCVVQLVCGTAWVWCCFGRVHGVSGTGYGQRALYALYPMRGVAMVVWSEL